MSGRCFWYVSPLGLERWKMRSEVGLCRSGIVVDWGQDSAPGWRRRRRRSGVLSRRGARARGQAHSETCPSSSLSSARLCWSPWQDGQDEAMKGWELLARRQM